MPLEWEAGRLVHGPDGSRPWARTHAALPFPVPAGDLVRVYFSPRDEQNRSHVSWVDTDPSDGWRVVAEADDPVLSPGTVGTFDDSGVSLGCVVPRPDGEYLYYVGWNLRVTVPWSNGIGLAIRRPGDGRFERVSRAPIIDRSDDDPFSLSYPFVIPEGGGWRMWYGSNTGWGPDPRTMMHVIKSARSDDGIAWQRDGRVAIGLAPGEFGVSRPAVYRRDGRFEMLFSVRRFDCDGYRLGFAVSGDGTDWVRCDEELVLPEPRAGAWDAGMRCYATRLGWGRAEWLLYNGDGFGRTGFGVARRVGPGSGGPRSVPGR